MSKIPFNRPSIAGKEIKNIQQAIENGHLSGNGPFTKLCQAWLEGEIGSLKVLLTHSCTAALEMAAILLDIQPGDEIIMPSFTFVSTANSFVLRGGVPVFVDIRPDTLNIDESKIVDAITPRTKAVVPVHYAGVGCEMDQIKKLAKAHNISVVEDTAQGIKANYKSKPLGSFGNLAALSFHETKNVISGEGGALLINDERYINRAEIIWEKGTDRAKFFRGQIDKYTWIDIGASYLPGELTAAFLYAQLVEAETISQKIMKTWNIYQAAFEELEAGGKIRRPIVPDYCDHNAHLYYLLLPDLNARTAFINKLREKDILAIFHYIPLHSSPAGLKYGRPHGDLSLTDEISERLVRLPLWGNMTEEEIDRVISASHEAIRQI